MNQIHVPIDPSLVCEHLCRLFTRNLTVMGEFPTTVYLLKYLKHNKAFSIWHYVCTFYVVCDLPWMRLSASRFSSGQTCQLGLKGLIMVAVGQIGIDNSNQKLVHSKHDNQRTRPSMWMNWIHQQNMSTASPSVNFIIWVKKNGPLLRSKSPTSLQLIRKFSPIHNMSTPPYERFAVIGAGAVGLAVSKVWMIYF